jgi:hypothetical protein
LWQPYEVAMNASIALAISNLLHQLQKIILHNSTNRSSILLVISGRIMSMVVQLPVISVLIHIKSPFSLTTFSL